MQLHSNMNSFWWIFAEFNPANTRRWNIIVQRSPGPGVLHHHSILSLYNTALILHFLDTLPDAGVQDAGPLQFVVIWDTVSFHRVVPARDRFTNHDRCIAFHLPPYTQLLNPLEEFFSAWRWKTTMIIMMIIMMMDSHTAASLFYKPGKPYSMQGDISPVAWRGRTWCLWCGRDDVAKCQQLNVFQWFPYNTVFCSCTMSLCLFFLLLQKPEKQNCIGSMFHKRHLKSKTIWSTESSCFA